MIEYWKILEKSLKYWLMLKWFLIRITSTLCGRLSFYHLVHLAMLYRMITIWVLSTQCIEGEYAKIDFNCHHFFSSSLHSRSKSINILVYMSHFICTLIHLIDWNHHEEWEWMCENWNVNFLKMSCEGCIFLSSYLHIYMYIIVTQINPPHIIII